MSEITTATNYHDFRKRFLDAVQKQQLQLHSIQVRGLSPAGKPIFTDIAHNVINPQMPTLIHVSGVHGIEGYLGSNIQSSILESEGLSAEVLQKVNVVFIHALNPYGMSWYRRVNAHNVDLNRNYYRNEVERPINSDFDFFAPIFEKRPTEKKWKIWKKALWAVFKLGIRRTAGAIAKGQYHQAESLFYGGSSVEAEVHEPLHYLQKLLKGCKKIYVIDVHSGLGKFASENFILDGLQVEADELFWKTTLASELINPMADNKYYRAEGTLADAFRDHFPDSELLYIFEEFGTKPVHQVLQTLMAEHKTFLKLKLDRMRAFQMIATFFPYEKGWRIKTADSGKQTYFRTLNAASETYTTTQSSLDPLSVQKEG